MNALKLPLIYLIILYLKKIHKNMLFKLNMVLNKHAIVHSEVCSLKNLLALPLSLTPRPV